jgi:signal transduction histidine kinase
MSEVNFNAILRELLENALKFSKDGTSIRLNGKVSKGGYEVSVEDMGIGMSQESLSRIKAFSQFDH